MNIDIFFVAVPDDATNGYGTLDTDENAIVSLIAGRATENPVSGVMLVAGLFDTRLLPSKQMNSRLMKLRK